MMSDTEKLKRLEKACSLITSCRVAIDRAIEAVADPKLAAEMEEATIYLDSLRSSVRLEVKELNPEPPSAF